MPLDIPREHYNHSKNTHIKDLRLLADEIRKDVITALTRAGSGHVAGSLGTADIFTALYFCVLNANPKTPRDPYRDRVVLSCGHICPVLYATLSRRGYLAREEMLSTLRKLGSGLQGHPHNLALPGIDASSGPLGQGLSQAIGLALAAKMDSREYRVYCVTSDGELNEGQIWEAAMFAPKNELDNLVWIIDRNNIQIDGFTEDLMPLEPLRQKLEAFNWYVIEIDGHNIEEIISSCNMAKSISQRPVAIIAHTIPGYGVKFMKYKFEWHGKTPNFLEAAQALKDLRTLEGQIKNDYD